jgi:hypothetical protein
MPQTRSEEAKVTLSLRLPETLHAACVEQADKERRSLGNLLVVMIEDCLVARKIAYPTPVDASISCPVYQTVVGAG